MFDVVHAMVPSSMLLTPLPCIISVTDQPTWCESLHMVLLRVEDVLRDEEREVRVLDAEVLDLGVKEGLHDLPHGVGPRTEDVAS